jgi:hypothetical protein
MLNLKTNLVPEITGTSGTIPKSLRQYLSTVPGNHEIKQTAKNELFCSLHTYTAVSAEVQFIL